MQDRRMQAVEKISVGILGATGAVGQKFVLLLEDHPWFKVGAVAASERSAGRPYAEVTSWKQPGEIPAAVRDLVVGRCEEDLNCEIVFSGLDSSVAGPIEEDFAKRGAWVFSNARNHRMASDVPLVIAEVNSDHLSLIDHQRVRRGWTGAIVTNANCSTIALAMSLSPLHRRFGVSKVQVATMQAISGAGFPGVPSIDILGNVIPFIPGEEEKIESETHKILGRLGEDEIVPADFIISAHANRVSVQEGHLECVSLQLSSKTQIAELEECLREFRGPPQDLGLPSAPHQPLMVRSQPDRPQPRLDLMEGDGMTVTVGRVRRCPILDFKYVLLGHNTIRGAAGASILNAEVVFRDRFIG